MISPSCARTGDAKGCVRRSPRKNAAKTIGRNHMTRSRFAAKLSQQIRDGSIAQAPRSLALLLFLSRRELLDYLPHELVERGLLAGFLFGRLLGALLGALLGGLLLALLGPSADRLRRLLLCRGLLRRGLRLGG